MKKLEFGVTVSRVSKDRDRVKGLGLDSGLELALGLVAAAAYRSLVLRRSLMSFLF